MLPFQEEQNNVDASFEDELDMIKTMKNKNTRLAYSRGRLE